MINVHNITSTADFGVRVDLKLVEQNYITAEKNPRRFKSVTLRIKEPKATVLLFESGKAVCIGTKNMNDNIISLEKIVEILKNLGYEAKIQVMKIRNIAGSFNMHSEIDLNGLALKHWKFCEYVPELFPGLKLTLPDSRATALVFTTGKVVITGVKTENAMKTFHRKVSFILDMFKKLNFE